MIFIRNLSLALVVFVTGFLCSASPRLGDGAAEAGQLGLLHKAYAAADYGRSYDLAKEFALNFKRSAYLPSVAWIGVKSAVETGKSGLFFAEALEGFDGHGKSQVLWYKPTRGRRRAVNAAKDAGYVFVDLPGAAAQRDYLIENNVISAGDCALVDPGDEIRNLLRYPDVLLKDFMAPLAGLKKGAVCFYGSGNYHHLARYLIQNIKSEVTVVVFDAHTDYRLGGDALFDCGSWVRPMMEQPNIKKVILIGINTEKKWFYENHSYRFPEDVLILQKGDAPSVYTGKFRRLRLGNMESPLNIPTKDVYISVDMDLLEEAYATTDWGNGKVSLDQVVSIIESIKKEHRIVGADICGLADEPDAKSLRSLARIALAVKEDIF